MQTWEYAIPDENLQSASDLLAKHGFPYVSPNPLNLEVYGDFEGKSRYHRNVEEAPKSDIRLQLLPLSVTCISLDDLQCTPSDQHPGPTIYRLPLPQHCLSLVQCIASYPSYPPGSWSRNKPCFELSALVAHAIFEYEYYSKDWDQPEESEEEYQEKVQLALKKVRSWSLPEGTIYWRKILETLVDGSRRPRDIPYKPDSQPLRHQLLDDQQVVDQSLGDQSLEDQSLEDQPLEHQPLENQLCGNSANS